MSGFVWFREEGGIIGISELRLSGEFVFEAVDPETGNMFAVSFDPKALNTFLEEHGWEWIGDL